MIAVIFEVVPASGQRDAYLDIAASLRPLLDEIDAFISIERFESLVQPGRSCRCPSGARRRLPHHRSAQSEGRAGVFADYQLRVADLSRDYGLQERARALSDSRAAHA